MRRIGDVVAACALLALTLPLMIVVGLAIKCDSPGPIFARETRIGRGGRRYRTLKFRTAEYDPEHTKAWALKTTGLGALLRDTRIDRLPQLINVLRGDMSVLDSNGNTPSFLK